MCTLDTLPYLSSCQHIDKKESPVHQCLELQLVVQSSLWLLTSRGNPGYPWFLILTWRLSLCHSLSHAHKCWVLCPRSQWVEESNACVLWNRKLWLARHLSSFLFAVNSLPCKLIICSPAWFLKRNCTCAPCLTIGFFPPCPHQDAEFQFTVYNWGTVSCSHVLQFRGIQACVVHCIDYTLLQHIM